ncbi:transcription initiation factor TFIID [Histoplasma capsulatum var. duboisii H88]|uniref:Transcription initiation factor TFIID n=1 Tax=Ajellomyces capsulatus (strain H88) TaxID=544711 RepID=F0UG58_AJEC8|nr:transcription initiation factor TFIID [Histoplasma capsulatum var. duboisii H88]
MTSPRSNPGASATSTQPLTPPADAPSSTSNNPSQANNPATTTATNNTSANPGPANATVLPATSLQDTGNPAPARCALIHMLLASLGDAVYLATEGYPGESAGAGTSTSKGGGDGKAQGGGQQAANLDLSSVSLGALRMSIASRLHYQFQPGLPKEFLMDVAAERNRMMLPGVMRGVDGGVAASAAAAAASAGGVMMGGMRLPPERFCLTGVGWGLKEEWESEGEEETGEGEMEIDADGNNNSGQQQAGGTSQVSITNERGDGGEDEDDGDGAMEDIFGDEGLDGEVRDEDKTMTDV